MTDNNEPCPDRHDLIDSALLLALVFSSCTPSTTPARSKRHTGGAVMNRDQMFFTAGAMFSLLVALITIWGMQ